MFCHVNIGIEISESITSEVSQDQIGNKNGFMDPQVCSGLEINIKSKLL